MIRGFKSGCKQHWNAGDLITKSRKIETQNPIIDKKNPRNKNIAAFFREKVENLGMIPSFAESATVKNIFFDLKLRGKLR